MDYDEPLPPFETRYPGKLEACLKQPFQEFSGSELYESTAAKASILFYLIIKNHPFINGNKRMAVGIMLVWLHINGLWINVHPDRLYDVAMVAAGSEHSDKEHVLRALEELFKDKIINLNDKKTFQEQNI